MVGIYRIVSPTNRIYIGQSWDIEDRLSHYKRHDCKKQRKLFASLSKYGFDKHKFEIMYVFQNESDATQDELNRLELWYANIYKCMSYRLLNIRECGGAKGKHSEETKKRISESNKGKTHSEATKRKLSESRMGKYTGDKNPFYGKKMSDELKEKLRQINKGKTLSNEHRAVLREKGKTLVGDKNPMYGKKNIVALEKARKAVIKSVIQIDKDNNIIAEYDSIINAHRATGIQATGIQRCCKGGTIYAGGFIWKYKNEN